MEEGEDGQAATYGGEGSWNPLLHGNLDRCGDGALGTSAGNAEMLAKGVLEPQSSTLAASPAHSDRHRTCKQRSSAGKDSMELGETV